MFLTSLSAAFIVTVQKCPLGLCERFFFFSCRVFVLSFGFFSPATELRAWHRHCRHRETNTCSSECVGSLSTCLCGCVVPEDPIVPASCAISIAHAQILPHSLPSWALWTPWTILFLPPNTWNMRPKFVKVFSFTSPYHTSCIARSSIELNWVPAAMT